MFSPPLPRRGQGGGGGGAPQRASTSSYTSAAYPIPSQQPSSTAFHVGSYPGVSGFSAFSQGQGMGFAEAEYPSSSYAALPGARGSSLGPMATSASPSLTRRMLAQQQQQAQAYAASLGPSAMGGHLASAGPSYGAAGGATSVPVSGRPSLARQHRSLEGEFPPGEAYLSAMAGPGVDIGTGSIHAGYPSQQPPGGMSGYGQGLQMSSMGPMVSGAGPGQGYSGLGSAFGPQSAVPPSQPLSVTTQGLGGASGPLSGPLSNPSLGLPSAPLLPSASAFSRDPYSTPLPVLQREHEMLRREYDSAVQKLNSTMASIKSFWSPELKKERSGRKEEASKLQLAQQQLRLATQEHQKQVGVVRQLQDELQCQYELRHQPLDLPPGVSRDSYHALRLERDRMHRELQLARDAMREMETELEAQRQTLASRDESVKRLLDLVQAKGPAPAASAQERLQLDAARQKAAETESRCRFLEGSVQAKDQDLRCLQEECLAANQKVRQLQDQCERLRELPASGPDPVSNNYQQLLDTKESRIEQLERQLVMYQDEVQSLRNSRLAQPRDFTDKTVTDPEYQEMKLKLEKANLELSHRQSELLALQTRIATMEEGSGDLKKHLQMAKEQAGGKEQQVSLLQGDIEALRGKLESKNEALEAKAVAVAALQSDKGRLNSENADLSEQMKIKEGKIQMLQRKLEGLEDFVKEKEGHIGHLKERLQSSPAMQVQRQLQDRVDEVGREKERAVTELRGELERMEGQRLELLENQRREVRDLRLALESLQKEITDRQMLIESQNEKICELNRELSALRARLGTGSQDAADSSELGRVRTDLDVARMEVEKLLSMNARLEGEKEELGRGLRETSRELEDAKRRARGGVTGGGPAGTTDYDLAGPSSKAGPSSLTSHSPGASADRAHAARIEELEEALRESVSITAERELAIAQHKQQIRLMEERMKTYQTTLGTVSQQYETLGHKVGAMAAASDDKEALARSLRQERRKHLEDVMQLKHEALVAALSEKDAHIALLENQHGKASPEELATLRRHKDRLVRKLKDENEKRARLLNDHKDRPSDLTAHLSSKPTPLDQDSLGWEASGLEWERRRLGVIIDHVTAGLLEADASLLTGLPRTQVGLGLDPRLLGRLPWAEQLAELSQRRRDLAALHSYARLLLKRLAPLQPSLARRARRLLDQRARPASASLPRSRSSQGLASFVSLLNDPPQPHQRHRHALRRSRSSQDVSDRARSPPPASPPAYRRLPSRKDLRLPVDWDSQMEDEQTPLLEEHLDEDFDQRRFEDRSLPGFQAPPPPSWPPPYSQPFYLYQPAPQATNPSDQPLNPHLPQQQHAANNNFYQGCAENDGYRSHSGSQTAGNGAASGQVWEQSYADATGGGRGGGGLFAQRPPEAWGSEERRRVARTARDGSRARHASAGSPVDGQRAEGRAEGRAEKAGSFQRSVQWSQETLEAEAAGQRAKSPAAPASHRRQPPQAQLSTTKVQISQHRRGSYSLDPSVLSAKPSPALPPPIIKKPSPMHKYRLV